MWHALYQHHLEPIDLKELRPTQISVGMAEVRMKRSEWSKLSRHRRHHELAHQVFPAVLGPKGRYYILDHHHLGLALQEEGIKQVWIALLDDLSWLEPEVFWRTLEFRGWAHPYDAEGQRCDFWTIPKRLGDLCDDPYRSLAGYVRRAGGFAKSEALFAEFLWADYFRGRVKRRDLLRSVPRCVPKGLRLARLPDARYLPGWSGQHG